MTRKSLYYLIFVYVLICVYAYWLIMNRFVFVRNGVKEQLSNVKEQFGKRIDRKEENDSFSQLVVDLKEFSFNSDLKLVKKLFPWLYNNSNLNNYIGERNSQGLVICTGNGHIRLTLVALKSLQLIGNDPPIEHVYSGSNDLSNENEKLLRKEFPQIDLIDLSLKYFNDSELKLQEWQIKPFAVLASQFQSVLL